MPALRPRFHFRERSTPEPAHAVRAHEGRVHQLLFVSEDSFVSAGEDGQLLQIGIDGRVVRAFDGHGGRPVNCLGRIDAHRFATGGDDAMVRVWNLDGTCELELEHHTDFVRSVAGREGLLVSVSEDRTIAFWDLSQGTMLRAEPLTEEPLSVAISPDGSLVVVATLDNAISAFDGRTCEPLDPFYRSDSVVVHTGRLYLSIPNDSGVGHRNPPNAVLFLADGTLISASEEIIAWDPGTRAQRLVRRMAWSPERMVAGERGLWVASMDLQQIDLDGRLLGWLPAPERDATAVGVSPHDLWIAGGNKEGTIHIFGKEVISQDSSRHRDVSHDLIVSWDGQLAATTDSENTHLVWSTASGELTARIEEPSMGASACAFTRDGLLITSGQEAEATLTLRRPNGEPLHRFDLVVEERALHPHAIASLAGGRIMVGVLSKGLYDWDPQGRERRTFTGRTQQISEIHAAPDGRTALTLGYFAEVEPEPGAASLGDSTGKLQAWDLERGDLLWTVSAGRPPLPPGERFVLPFSFGPIVLWDRGVLCGSGDAKGVIALRDVRSGKEQCRLPLPGHVYASRVDGDRLSLLASESEVPDPPMFLYTLDLARAAVLDRIDLPIRGVRSAVFAGSALAVIASGQLSLCDPESGEIVERIDGIEGTLAVRGGVLCATTRDGRIAAFDVS